MTQDEVGNPDLDPIDSLCSSLNPTIVYEQISNKICETPSKIELAMYHHQLLGSPPRSTFPRVIRKHPQLFTTFSGLTH